MADNKSPPEPQAGDPMYGDDPSDLSEKEKAEIRAHVKKQLAEEVKKSARQRFREQEERRLRYEEGMTVGGVEDDMVTITLDLAEHSACLATNGRQFWHGRTYTVPRHVARDLMWREWAGWQHQYEVDGKSKTQFYQAHKPGVVSGVKGVSGFSRTGMG